MLSLTCRTAIKVVIYLASKFESGEKAGIKEIARRIRASEHTIGKLVQTLVRQDIINSIKGPSGGFYVSKEQMKQPIMNIVEVIDGKRIFTECGLGLSKCSDVRPCPIHHEYKKSRDLAAKLFSSKKISDLCAPVNGGIAYLI